MSHAKKSPSRSSPPELEPQTNDLMELMTEVILADGHIYPSEIEALTRGVDLLGLKNHFGDMLTSIEVKAWFEAYRTKVKSAKEAIQPDVALTHIILKLSEWPEKQAVVDVLTKISLADADFHLKEKSLISIVRAFWQFEGLDASGAKILPSS